MGPGLRRDGEKDNSRIVTMFIEANWVTASKAGAQSLPLDSRFRGNDDFRQALFRRFK